MIPDTWVHALDDTHGPFCDIETPQDLPQDFSWHTIKGFFNVDKGKVDGFVGGGIPRVFIHPADYSIRHVIVHCICTGS